MATIRSLLRYLCLGKLARRSNYLLGLFCGCALLLVSALFLHQLSSNASLLSLHQLRQQPTPLQRLTLIGEVNQETDSGRDNSFLTHQGDQDERGLLEQHLPSMPTHSSSSLHNSLSVDRELLKLYKTHIFELERQIEVLRRSHQSCSGLQTYLKTKMDSVKRGGGGVANEYEVTPQTHFTFTRIYPATPGLGKRVVEKPVGEKKRELIQVLGEGLRVLRSANLNRTLDDFLEGTSTIDPGSGIHYQLYFKTAKKSAHFYHKVSLLRPLVPLKMITNEIISTKKEVVNLIVPISETRLEQFRTFLDNAKRVARYDSGRLRMFVVYYGDVDKISAILPTNLTAYKLQLKLIVAGNYSGLFSRAKALQIGAEVCCGKSDLLFLCDVDILFTWRFLERCRINASQAKKVYYPIVFSFYNPSYSQFVLNNPDDRTLVNSISPQNGFWRDFGFGMSCMYQADFMTVGGFTDFIRMTTDEQLVPDDGNDASNEINQNTAPVMAEKSAGKSTKPFRVQWGGEDVLLYRKLLQFPNVTVIRSIDPGIFHIWHDKDCHALNLSGEQLRSCLSSKALNEANQAQLSEALGQLKLQSSKSSKLN